MIATKRFSRLRGVAIAAASLALLGGCSVLGGGSDKNKTPTVGNRKPILSQIAQVVTADPSLAQVAVVVPSPQVNADWPQAAGSANKSMGNVALGNAPARIWTATIPGTGKRERLAAAPVVGGGMLFAVDVNGSVQAFDAATGAKRWDHPVQVEKDLRPSTFGGGATYFEGKVYATSGAGDVVKLDANTGAEEWRVKPAGPLRGSPTVAFNAVYAMTQDNQIIALDATDGHIIWQDAAATGDSGVFGVAAPAAGQGTVIAGYSTGEIVAYRYENGRTLWSDALSRTSISTSVSTLTDVDADPIIDNGRVYALGQGGRMAAYELVTGQRIWELPIAGISTPVVAGEWLFTLTDDARMIAVARTSGKVRWITQLTRYKNPEKREGPVFWTGPVLANGRLWIANTEGELKSVDAMTGEAADFAEFSSAISLPPVVANQTLYILEDSGKITAFR